jgi:hypothetical protein
MRNIAPDVLLQCRDKSFNNFETLDKASRDLLYEYCKGCHKEHIVLWMTLKLLKLKASNWWSDSSFSSLLELLSKAKTKWCAHQHVPSKEGNLSIDIGCRKNPCLPKPLHLILKRT